MPRNAAAELETFQLTVGNTNPGTQDSLLVAKAAMQSEGEKPAVEMHNMSGIGAISDIEYD